MRHSRLKTDDPCSSTSSLSSLENISIEFQGSDYYERRRGKSMKRRAAEAKASTRAKQRCVAAGQYSQDRNRIIDGCNVSCDFQSSEVTKCVVGREWCSMPVSQPERINWQAVVQQDKFDTESQLDFRRPFLSHGIDVSVVESEDGINGALKRLYNSKTDDIIAIDLEWRPDVRNSNNPVALIQLATQTCCILLRCCKWDNRCPMTLRQFFQNPRNYFVSFAWDSCDEGKMLSTFGFGKDIFGHFLDLQYVASQLGYPSIGLSQLSEVVLTCPLPKEKSIARSDWEQKKLDRKQVRYAALDALIPGNLFRILRTWHASPTSCSSCKQPLGRKGMIATDTVAVCVQCKKKCKTFTGLLCHMEATGHAAGIRRCKGCKRIEKI